MTLALRDRLRQDAPLHVGWCSLPGPLHAAAMAALPYEAILCDMQHGLITSSDIFPMLSAFNAAGKYSFVRVRWNDPGLVGQIMDAGAQAVIVPMVNSVGDAQSIVQAAKYPPLGGRSWGAYASSQLPGFTKDRYLAEANGLTLILAMIETTQALDALDDILAVPGLDGVFVGPNDLTLSLNGGTSLDSSAESSRAAFARIAATAKKTGHISGIFGGNPAFAKQGAALGYDFITAGSDTGMMDTGARAFLDALKHGN